MLTDSYGGICPNCGYDRMLVRYGSYGYFQYDACPNCAFCYGHNHYDPEMNNEWEFWEDLIGYFGDAIPEKSFLGILLYIETLPDIKEIESVFDYSDFDWSKI